MMNDTMRTPLVYGTPYPMEMGRSTRIAGGATPISSTPFR